MVCKHEIAKTTCSPRKMRSNTNKPLSCTDSGVANTQQPEPYEEEKHRQSNEANDVIFSLFLSSKSNIDYKIATRTQYATKRVVLCVDFCHGALREIAEVVGKKCLFVKLRTYYMSQWRWANPTMPELLLVLLFFYHWLSYLFVLPAKEFFRGFFLAISFAFCLIRVLDALRSLGWSAFSYHLYFSATFLRYVFTCERTSKVEGEWMRTSFRWFLFG